MSRHKRVMDTFMRFRETGDAVLLAQCGKLLSASRQQFMSIALMSHVPDNGILWAVENTVESHSQLHDTQIG